MPLACRLVVPALLAAAAALTPRMLQAVGTPGNDQGLVEIAADAWLLRGAFEPGRQPDGNSVVLAGPDGLVVIDSGRHPPHAAALLAFARARAQPVVALVNTHWHLDHVGGNPTLRAAHPALRVHGSDAIDAALHGFLARYREQLVAQLADAPPAARAALQAERDRIDGGAALRPDRIVREAREATLAGRPLQLGLARHAVTAADVWVYDPATRVLIAGDLVTLPAPFLDTACPEGWQRALASLPATGFRRLVPGHGAPMTRRGFDRWRRAFDALLLCAAGDAPAASCSAGWQRDAGSLLQGHPEGFTRELVDYYVGRLRGPNARRDCPAAG
jgi:glyoxylase-like metal-dependent hydrolase (beta-lactamase superfamily II)